MTHGSLFSGIGGAELAAEWAGWNNLFHCEINPFGRKVIDYYWPNSISYEDITKTDFTIWRGRIDVLTGGFPCQPFSAAGKRKGTEDDRHLWPEMYRVIKEVQPRWIMGENVRGFTDWNGGMVFDQVLSDLEAEGYEVLPFLLPAVSVNAPHRRDRIYIVAHAFNGGHCAGRGTIEETDGIPGINRSKMGSRESNGASISRLTTNPRSMGWEQGASIGGQVSKENGRPESDFGNNAPRTNSDTGDTGLQGSEIIGNIGGSGTERKKQSSRFFRPDWRNFPTQSPVCSRNDGLPGGVDGITFSKWRQESIKAYGNAWVPQVAYQIFKAINQYENQ